VNLSSIVSTKSPALLFVNPQAGGGHAESYLPRVLRFFSSQEFPVEAVRTQSAEDLEERARAALKRGQRLLIAMGGDGAFQGLVNAAYGSVALLGLLPAGGGNDFAAALGIPADPVAAALALIHGWPRWTDLLRARTADGCERLYVGGGGVGLDAEAAKFASGAFRNLPGTLRYVAAALWALRGFSPLEITLTFPEDALAPMRTTALLAAALNTPSYGAGLRLAPEARPDDGWLDAVVVEKMGFLEILEILPRLAQRGAGEIPVLKSFRARRVRLAPDRPCQFHGDGEIFGPAPVDIEVVPRAVQVLAPENSQQA